MSYWKLKWAERRRREKEKVSRTGSVVVYMDFHKVEEEDKEGKGICQAEMRKNV